MKTVNMSDFAPISGTRKTQDGYLVADVRVARTGIQEYLGREVDPDNSLGLRDMGVVRVFRPVDEVFSEGSLRTYAHRPITSDHPSHPVNSGNWKDLSVGQTGGDVVRDGDWVRVPMVLMDENMIQAVEGGKRQLSMGYSCIIDATPGETQDGQKYDAVQRELRMNHLAVVAAARAGGMAKIGDRQGDQPINKPKEDVMSDALKTLVLGDKAVRVSAEDAALIEQFKIDSRREISDLVAKHENIVSAKDEEIGTLRAELKKAQDAVVKPEEISKLVADRLSLERQVLAVDAKIKTDGKTDEQLRREVVVSVLGEKTVGDASDAEVRGMFKAVCRDVSEKQPNQKLVSALSGTTDVSDARQAYDTALEKSIVNLNAHRKN